MALSQEDINAIVSSVSTILGPQLSSITAQMTKVQEIYDLMGLDSTKPLIVTQTQRTAGSNILQSISVNDQTHTTIVQRILTALGIGSMRIGSTFRVR